MTRHGDASLGNLFHMYGSLKWIALAVLGLALSALIHPHFVTALDSVGWYDEPLSAVGALNWMERLIGAAAFPWVAGVMIGFCAGVWLDWILKSRNRSYPTRDEKLRQLGERSLWLADTIIQRAANDSEFPSGRKYDAFLEPDVESIKIDYQKNGLMFPARRRDILEKRQNNLIINTLRRVGTLLRDGHFEEAKREAEKAKSLGESPASEINRLN